MDCRVCLVSTVLLLILLLGFDTVLQQGELASSFFKLDANMVCKHSHHSPSRSEEPSQNLYELLQCQGQLDQFISKIQVTSDQQSTERLKGEVKEWRKGEEYPALHVPPC